MGLVVVLPVFLDKLDVALHVLILSTMEKIVFAL
jgi:hypothetical protein